MWPDLRKAAFHAHNSKTHFSPSNDSYTRWLTIQPGNNAESWPGCFCYSLFLRLVRCLRVSGSPSNGCMSPWQATTGCNSPHNWLMSLANDLTALCDMWRWKWHQWMPFGWFKWRRSHCPPLCGYLPAPTLPPCRSATGICYASKNYLNWWEIQLAIHPIVGG